MTTARFLFECLPGLFFLGFGIDFFLTALVPSHRRKNWRHWKYFGFENRSGFYGENPLLQALGFFQMPRPDREGDWDVKTAVRLYLGMGICFSLIGISLIVPVVRASMI